MQHFGQKGLIGNLIVYVFEVQELLHTNTDDANLRQTQEDLSELVLHVRIEAEAVLEQRSVHLLLALLHIQTVFQARDVCTRDGNYILTSKRNGMMLHFSDMRPANVPKVGNYARVSGQRICIDLKNGL